MVLSQANVGLLGDLYAFGLLGAFTMTCLALDIVRWHERWGRFAFAVGVVTTMLVTLAWITNLFAKPLATLFGGGITVLGMIIAVTTYYVEQHQGLPAVFPHIHREQHPIVMIDRARRMRPCQVLAVLPHHLAEADALVDAAASAADGLPVIFYMPWNAAPGMLRQIWENVRPGQTLTVSDEQSQAATIPGQRVERVAEGSVPILHYFHEAKPL
ncbi:MAG TPA: hypothetical protein VIN39_05810 [Candidatus Dormibacteraeota bacterium]